MHCPYSSHIDPRRETLDFLLVLFTLQEFVHMEGYALPFAEDVDLLRVFNLLKVVEEVACRYPDVRAC